MSVANNYDRVCCATCLNVMRNFIPCSMCVDAVFCSLACYQQNQIHRMSCGEAFHRMPTPAKFVIQSILKAISIFPAIDFLIQFVEVSIASPNFAAAAEKFRIPLDAKLQSYGLFLKQKIQNSLSMEVVYQAYTTLLRMTSIEKRFHTRSKKRFLMHLIGHHTMVLNCNAHGGFEDNQYRFVYGTMANLVALIEHSCTPNVVHFAYGNQEVCIAVRPIRAGERLCYDYNWPDDDADGMTVQDRKQILWEQWRIDCKCRKCCMRNGIKSNLQMAADPAYFFVSKFKAYCESNQATIELLKQKCMHFLNKFKDEPWSKEMEIITKAFSQCILDEYNRNYG